MSSIFLVEKKGGQMRPVINLHPQRVRALPTFQNGGNPSPTGNAPAGQLNGKTTPSGRLPDGTDWGILPGLPPFSLEWQALMFHLPAI